MPEVRLERTKRPRKRPSRPERGIESRESDPLHANAASPSDQLGRPCPLISISLRFQLLLISMMPFRPALEVVAWLKKNWLSTLARVLNNRVIVRLALRNGTRHSHYFFCSATEREAYPHLPASVLPNLAVIPRGANVPDFSQSEQPALMFVGLLEYGPNRDAVDWFLADIWPRIRAQVPEARFRLVGKVPDELRQRWAAHPQVEVLGFVDSLAEVYRSSSAAVVPMRSGGGTNIKALEAYAYGRPVVATSHVLNGHRPLFRPSVDMMAADDADGFARHCVTLLMQPEQARRMAISGQERIAAHLSKDRFFQILDEAVSRLLPGRRAEA